MASSLSVFIATPSTNGQFPIQTLSSYLDTQEACLRYGIKLDFGFATCSLVHHARTLLANTFLGKPEFNRLFWIDSDMQWTSVDFMKVLHHTLKHDCVAGVYPRRIDPTAYHVRFTDPAADPDEDGLVEIDATGLGFACIKRNVMAHLARLAPKLKHGSQEAAPSIFRCDDDGTEARGEDYAFWADVKEQGYKVFADCTLTLGHVGSKVYKCPASTSLR
jgi:hypothetical protein